MASVHLYIGTDRSDRRAALLDAFVKGGPQARLMVPSRRYARELTSEILQQHDVPGWFGGRVQTFQDFTAELLRGTEFDLPLVSEIEQRLLLQEAVDRAIDEGALDSLGDAARSGGFLQHAHRIIAQLKQTAVRPEDFRERVLDREDSTTRDTVVEAVYRHYQQGLQQQRWVDIQGMYWMADIACTESRPALLDSVRSLYLDGFDDFTSSEFRLLQSLAPHVDTMVFGLNRESELSETDEVYARVAHTQQQIETSFSPQSHGFSKNGSATDLSFAAAHWFGHASPPPPPVPESFSFRPCRDVRHELEWTARRIKHLCLREGVSPGDIAVVARSWSGLGRRIRHVFGEMGVPVRAAEPISLAETGLGSFVLRLLDLAPAWRREDVVDTLTSSFYCPGTIAPEYREAYDALAREAYIHEGATEWKNGLDRLGKRWAATVEAERTDRLRRHVPYIGEALESLQTEFGVLVHELVGTAPDTATRAEHTRHFLDALNNLGMQGLETEDAETISAYDTLWSTLGILVNEDASSADSTVDRETWAQLCKDLLRRTTIELPSQAGGVSVVDLEQLRHLRFDHVFLLRANEGTLPGIPSPNALYSTDDVARLSQQGIALLDADTHMAQEVLLFHRLLDAPRATLTFVWSMLTPGDQPLLPSPFVRDVWSLFATDGTSLPQNPDDPLSIAADNAACARDVADLAMRDEAPAPRELHEVLRELADRTVVERGRFDKPDFDEFDGMLNREEIRDALAAKYGESHVFSANQLETYLDCPFRFFLERILDVETPELPDPSFDVRVRGLILHRSLERFYRELTGTFLHDQPREHAQNLLDESFDRAFEEFGWRGQAHPGFASGEREHLRLLLHRFLDRAYAEKPSVLSPAHFEVSFGNTREEAASEISQASPFELTIGDESIRLAGRIDRIDLDDEQKQARIVDYKTSLRIGDKHVVDGSALQLTLYALALENYLLPDHECLAAQYLDVTGGKQLEALKKGKIASNQVGWAERRATALERVQETVAGIREGRFHPRHDDEPCSRCPHEGVCRYQRARMIGKQAPV